MGIFVTLFLRPPRVPNPAATFLSRQGTRATPSMSAAPTRIANVGLYRKLLRAAQGFAQYNVRDYAVRYIRDDFRAAASFSGQEVCATSSAWFRLVP